MGRRKAQITVLKCMDNSRLQEEQRRGRITGPCSQFEVGQSFVAGRDVPEGFCNSAWADIQNDLVMIQCGGSPGYIDPDNTMISCCRDGLCPVIFKIEQTSEPY